MTKNDPASPRGSCGVIAILVFAFLILLLGAGFWLYQVNRAKAARTGRVLAWLREPASHTDWQVEAGQRCGDAPFLIPTNGYIGYLWDDSFRIGHRHQGVDIFAGTDVNITPVIAVYAGYLTRQPDWKSTVIIRLPEDPLQPGRQIWTYYTHMAGTDGTSFVSPDFPPGTYEMFVEAGSRLGYQGNYSGTPGNPVGVHLHFSIVLDDGEGKYRNELEINNTLDPSPYLGLPLNAGLNADVIPVCE